MPKEAWPLKPPSTLDLDWLRMSNGKNETWKITQPSRADSVFQPLGLETMNYLPISPTVPGLEALTTESIKLYGLDTTSNTEINPYHTAASALAPRLNFGCKHFTTLNFLSFISYMRPSYKRLQE